MSEQIVEKSSVKVDNEEKNKEKNPWKVILFNDRFHTFDEVILQLMKAIGCGLDRAKELTLEVHFKGKANVYEGEFEDCFQVNNVLKEINLITEIEG